MPKKSFQEIIVEIITTVFLLICIAGAIMFAIAQFKNFQSLSTFGIVFFALGFVGWIVKFPILSIIRRKAYERAKALVAVLEGKYKLPEETATDSGNNRDRSGFCAKLKKMTDTNKRLDVVARQMREDEKVGRIVRAPEEEEVNPAAEEPKKKVKTTKEKKEIKICENCGTEMRLNVRGEWVCSYCDSADIDVDALRKSMQTSFAGKPEETKIATAQEEALAAAAEEVLAEEKEEEISTDHIHVDFGDINLEGMDDEDGFGLDFGDGDMADGEDTFGEMTLEEEEEYIAKNNQNYDDDSLAAFDNDADEDAKTQYRAKK